MVSKRDTLEVIKDRIKNEAKHGDKAKACRRADITPTTYDSGLKRVKYDDLTDGESLVLSAHIAMLDERKAKENEIRSKSSN